jgi:hypothetical protein
MEKRKARQGKAEYARIAPFGSQGDEEAGGREWRQGLILIAWFIVEGLG